QDDQRAGGRGAEGPAQGAGEEVTSMSKTGHSRPYKPDASARVAALWHGLLTVPLRPTAGLPEPPLIAGVPGDLRSGWVRRSGDRATTGRSGDHATTGKRARRLLSLARASGWCGIALLVLLLDPSPAHAYIGPGAGFALAGSFLAVFAAFFSALVLLFT